jgi:cathepsin L
MRVVLGLLLLCALGAWAAPRNLEGYTFAHYQKEFNKVYTSQVTLRDHMNTFNNNLAKIRKINEDYAAGKSSWYAAVNKFTDLSARDMQKFKGHAKAPRAYSVPPSKLSTTNLPASVDWRAKNLTTPVKDQGGCGSCWTFSTVETFESHIAIRTGQLFVLSEQQVVSCATNPGKCGGTGGCEGATQEIAFNYTRDAGGLSLESSYPYEGADSACDSSKVKPVATIDGYVKLDTNNATQLQAALANIGPIAISVAAGGLFQLYGGGVFNTKGLCGWDIGTVS